MKSPLHRSIAKFQTHDVGEPIAPQYIADKATLERLRRETELRIRSEFNYQILALQNDETRQELAKARNRPVQTLANKIELEVLRRILDSGLPLSKKLRARFDKSARKRDPRRGLYDTATSHDREKDYHIWMRTKEPQHHLTSDQVSQINAQAQHSGPLIYCISQLMAALNAGREISRTLTLRAHDLLVATNRETSGDGYKRLREAFERLAGTRITTNMMTGGQEVTSGFGLIESWQIVRASRGGRMVSVSVVLSEWLFRAVDSKSVLTLSTDYFRLRKPLERRIYELARKHCGRQKSWRVSVEVLLKKSGSASPRRVFRKMIRDMIKADHLPGYEMSEEEGDLIRFSARGSVVEDALHLPPLSNDAIEAARALAPGMDVYVLGSGLITRI